MTASAAATALGAIEPKTAVPPVRSGVVRRDALVRRLLESGGTPVVSICAPAGYGKTTLLSQWAEADARPFAWLSLDDRDNDPLLLLRCVVAAVERAEGTAAAGSPRVGRIRTWSSFLPEVSAALSRSEGPVALVIDDVHVLAGESLDALVALARILPDGGQLVLSGRSELTALVARSRAGGKLLELGASDLALTEQETFELLESCGLDLAEATVATLHRRTEGWAAGLYLAMLAAQSTGAFSIVESTERFVDDYLHAEHLARLPDAQLSFLTRSSVLDRMCASLCDAMLGRRDSQRMLEAIERANLFVVPLDRERRWFRYHELFRAVLRGELDRADPDAARPLLLRAADWCEDHGLPDEAMEYALAAHDTERAARLLTTRGFPLYRTGRVATVERWLESFDDGALLARYPTVGAVGALVHALRGRAFQAERWVDAGARAADAGGPLIDGSPNARPWLATVEALLCRHGPERMQADAALAVGELGPLSPLRAPALWLHATALLLRGDTVGADAELERAAAVADELGATFAGLAAVAQRALLALDRNDAPLARALLARAHASVDHGTFEDYAPMSLLHVADARLDIREGDTERAAQHLAAAQRLRPFLTHAVPVHAVLTLLELARAYVALDDVKGAGAVLVDAAEILRHRPRLGVLAGAVSDLRRRLAGAEAGHGGWASSLTAAELRLLPLLTTHLTFREIGERLFVSRNTVKTEAISIYRKLGVTSRGEAVNRAVELGLVEAVVPATPRITLSG